MERYERYFSRATRKMQVPKELNRALIGRRDYFDAPGACPRIVTKDVEKSDNIYIFGTLLLSFPGLETTPLKLAFSML